MTTTPWGGVVRYREVTGSTMDDAQVLEDSGAPDGSVAWAGLQRSGRGRHPGRTWVSRPGQGLLFTVYWSAERFHDQRFAASLTVGLGVCLWLESLGLDDRLPVRLKWPNDVYLGDRKLAGILVRRRLGAERPSTVHAGIGINLLATPDDQSFRAPPISLADAGVSLDPETALSGLLSSLAVALELPEPWTACAQRLWKRDEELMLTLPDGTPQSGIARAVSPSGALIWERDGVREALSSAE